MLVCVLMPVVPWRLRMAISLTRTALAYASNIMCLCAAMTSEEEAIHRRQVAELRARAAGQPPPPTADAGEEGGGSAAGGGGEALGVGMVRDEVTGQVRRADAQGPTSRLMDDG